MKVLVTGADGFVGTWLLRRLLEAGHEVGGAVQRLPAGGSLGQAERSRVRWLQLDLTAPATVEATVSAGWDAIVHLAAIAWSRDVAADPGQAWLVNAGGTVRMLEAAGRARERGVSDPYVLVVSTAEVYGPGAGVPRTETDPLEPWSAYAATKVGAEIGAKETADRYGLRLGIARPFTHTGPGQRPVFFVPALIDRLRAARHARAPVVKTGNLEPVRDFVDVRDVVDAYARLLEQGGPGGAFNVASGRGWRLADLFRMLAGLMKVQALPEADATLLRTRDIPHLVGDATRLREATGWSPRFSMEQTLADMIHAQTD